MIMFISHPVGDETGHHFLGAIFMKELNAATTTTLTTRRTVYFILSADSEYKVINGGCGMDDHYLDFSLENMLVCAGEVEVEEHEAMLLRSSKRHGNLETFPSKIQAVVEKQYGTYYDSFKLVLLTIVSHSKDSYPNVSSYVDEYCRDSNHDDDGFTSITICVM